jgi:hypothetical protein
VPFLKEVLTGAVNNPVSVRVAVDLAVERSEYVFTGWMPHNPGLLEARADVYFNDEFFVQLHHKGTATAFGMHRAPSSYRIRAVAEQTTLAIEDVAGQSYFRGAALNGLSVTLALD